LQHIASVGRKSVSFGWKCVGSLLLLAILPGSSVALTQIPSPEQFFGHPVGAEGKLIRWDGIVRYMQAVARGSDRVQFRELGKTTGNNPFVLMVISSPSNLGNMERYKSINRRLFDPRTIDTGKEAQELIQEAKLFVMVTCSIHANEIGASQMSVEAVYRLATEESERILKILNNVVFLLVPCVNPDGQIMVTDWYNKTLRTPYEGSPLPWLYHQYVGHDNNRDAYMFTQKETQLIGRALYQDWLPAVWLDEHEMESSGPRMFVMPAMDPINPNVDPLIYRNVGLLGFSQAAALERLGKEGVIYGDTYSYWWEGAMAWAGLWHNMLGLLTEVASARLATTVEQQRAHPGNPPRSGGLEEAASGPKGSEKDRLLPPPTDLRARVQYPRPWHGGEWSLRDIVDYELIATLGLLESSADLRVQLLDGLYAVGKRQIELGKNGDPFAIVVPRDQSDRPTVVKMLQTLANAGIEVQQARAPFTADGRSYPTGSYVILLSQPFRAYAKDILEAQVYPAILTEPGVPPDPPYDIAGWSLGMQMGVNTYFVKEPFKAELDKLTCIELPAGRVSGQGSAYVLSHEPNNSLVAVNRLLKQGYDISWLTQPVQIGGKSFGPGAIIVGGGSNLTSAIVRITQSLGIDAVAADLPRVRSIRISAPRTALYQPWGGSTDEGWTRWVLEQNEFAYHTVHPKDVRKDDLIGKYDAIIFPDITSKDIIAGSDNKNWPDEFRGGIEKQGVRTLRAFVEEGGTVIALGRSSSLLMDELGAPFSDSLRGVEREQFFCPGSILRVLVDNTHPIGYGMNEEAGAYFINSMALEPFQSLSAVHSSVVVRFPNSDLLMSGWLKGRSYLYNKVGLAEVRLGKGRMILMPLRVQHRGQSYGTFKFLFNSILTSAAEIDDEEMTD